MLKYRASAILLFLPGAVQAASDDAWKAFARTVEQKCLAAAADMVEAPRVVVDPFGSESYGLAIVTGRAKGATTEISHICVMDKRNEAVELGGELSPEKVRVTAGD